jgi:predicted RND superfamily exporter protein
LGIIALIGIFVNDALVFITTFNEKIRQGMAHRQAVIETGRARFRPILLTSITTIAGLAPLILEKSLQAQFLIPMAISVAYGLLVGTFVLLVLIPALLMITNRIKVSAMSFYEGEMIRREVVEPAYRERKSNFVLFVLAGILAGAAFVMLIMVLMKVSDLIV